MKTEKINIILINFSRKVGKISKNLKNLPNLSNFYWNAKYRFCFNFLKFYKL